VWDARGHLIEPYTAKSIGLGGIEVTHYLASWDSRFEEYPDIAIERRVKTTGPLNRFDSVLFVEKEGFTEILKDAGIQERFDIAIMSTKGLPVKAACDLANALDDEDIKILVLHDFDLAGFKILKTLEEGTRMAAGVAVTEIGLRLGDITGLQSEPVVYKQQKDPRWYLRDCGATKEEREFLVEGNRRAGGWVGQRVELNAMTSVQLVQFIERKLQEHGVSKVVPEEDILASAFRRAWFLQQVETRSNEIKEQLRKEAIEVPADLKARVAEVLDKRPGLSWDDAIWKCAGGKIQSQDDATDVAKTPPTQTDKTETASGAIAPDTRNVDILAMVSEVLGGGIDEIIEGMP
jgi:hypothetical protein